MGELLATLLVFGWPLCGIIGHVRQSNEMVTWCGTPVWEETATWVCFFPAMLLGPITLAMFEEFPDRHPERAKKALTASRVRR